MIAETLGTQEEKGQPALHE